MQRGLQQIIPARNTTIQTHCGKTMSIAAARKELLPAPSNSRKRPTNERPSDSIYISNAGNRSHRNHLSRRPMDPHSTTSQNRALSPIHEEQRPTNADDMHKRVANRLFSTMTSLTEDSPVKARAAKAYDKLSKKDDGIINLVSAASSAASKNGDKLSQDIANVCIDFQRRLDK
jgi:hypothetical protein